MVLQCLTWIPELWSQLVISRSNKRRNDNDIIIRELPDNVVFDILTRLPAESVLKCRRVSKHWLALTSSHYFAEMHLKRASPNLLVQCCVLRCPLMAYLLSKWKVNLFIYENFHRLDGKWSDRPVMGNEDYGFRFVGRCDGLVVLWSGLRYYVRNMVTREQVIIDPLEPTIIFMGIFFHPVAREYKLLFHGHKSPNSHQYPVFIYSPRSKVWREVATAFSYRPRVNLPNPVASKDTLYWMSDSENEKDSPCNGNSIIMFKTYTESFHCMHHPRWKCLSVHEHKGYILLEMDGLLSCCCFHGTLVSIYVLDDRSNWVWRYKVDLYLDEKKFPFYGPWRSLSSPRRFVVWKIENDEIIFYSFFRGLFRCHLQHNTVKQIDFPKLTGEHTLFAMPCTKSVVSLMAT